MLFPDIIFYRSKQKKRKKRERERERETHTKRIEIHTQKRGRFESFKPARLPKL